MNWTPATFLFLGAASIGSTFKPAGLDKSIGVMTAGYIKDPSDPRWVDDPEMVAWKAWMKENMPEADRNDMLPITGYAFAQTLEQVLRQCGDDLTRESIMRQAANLKNFRLGVLLPGSLINTSPTDYRVVRYMALQRFNGISWDEVK